MRPAYLALPFALLLPGSALAHGATAPAPEYVWMAWDPPLAIALLLLAVSVAYGIGVRRVWKRAGRGRGIRVRNVASFAGGIVALSLAILSPLEPITGALFSAHMIQHLLLMLIAPPLLALGRPLLGMFWSLPRRKRRILSRWWLADDSTAPLRATWNWLRRPGVAWTAQLLALWFWHVPAPYDAAVHIPAIHDLEHATFLGAATLFWWSVTEARSAGASAFAALSTITTALHASALGALLTFSRSPWYESHTGMTVGWGLTRLEDQQLAGLIMWVPGGVIYGVTALILLSRLLRESPARSRAPVLQPPASG